MTLTSLPHALQAGPLGVAIGKRAPRHGTAAGAGPGSSYRRIILRQRRRSLRVASLAAVLLAIVSVLTRLVIDPAAAPVGVAAASLVAATCIALAVPGIASGRLWIATTLLGIVGVVVPVAAVAVEPAGLAMYGIGTVGTVPIAVAVFATWSRTSQLAWTILGAAVLLAASLVAGWTAIGGHAPVGILMALGRAYILGAGFGLAAAHLFQTIRIGLYRSARVAHARRTELVGVHRLAARTLARMQAVESIGATLTDQGATPAALDLVLGILNDAFGYSHPSIYLGDETRVRLGAQRGYDTPVEQVDAGQWVIGRALTSGQVQLVSDVAGDADYRAASSEVVSQIAVPLRADGRIIGILNVESRESLDERDLASISVVADRVAAALDLAGRHHTLEAIVDGAPVAIVAYDRNGSVRFWGAAAERLFGWSADEVRGRPSPFATSIDVRDDPAHRSIVEGQRVDGVETEREDRNGNRVPVRIFAAPFRDAPGDGQVVVYQDLASERRSASALAASEARYQSLVTSLHEGVVLQDGNGTIVASNPAAERIIGLTVDQMMGRTSFDPLWRAIHEDGSDFRGGDHPASIALATRRPVLDVIMGIHKPSGELSWVSVDAVPLQAGASPAGGVVVSFSDITDRQRLQSDLLQSQKMDSVGRLAGGIAHDFNNLLTAILGNTQMLAELVDGVAAEHVGEILGAAERAADLTRQLLGFARKSMLDPGDHELNAIVTDMEPMIRRLVGAHIAVVTRLDREVGHVRVDRSQMDQVLLNLAVNARDAMADGGVLTIETAVIARADLDPSIVVEAERVAILSVRDSGVGMNEDVRRHAFDPFYTTKPRGRGTGLGLATTHGIIAQSGGAITVDSTPSDGSTFAVYLPEVQAADMPPIAAVSAVAPIGHGTILLVEDEAAVREVARRILERAGYRVIHAPNAKAALSVMGSAIDDIDLLVSDVIMPGMRGPEMYELLLERRPDLPAVFLSGYADLADATDALPRGSRFLAKPYSSDDLVRIVQRALADRAA